MAPEQQVRGVGQPAATVQQAAGEPVPCPELDVEDLAAGETSGRRMMAYCWMARRYPAEYPEAALACARRLSAEEAVEGFLRENPWRRGPRRAA